MKDISVIIINYNTASYTISCVESVIKLTNPKLDIEIIVVDNNSKSEDYSFLKESLPKSNKVKLYRSIINTGFGGGNMFGAQFAHAKYLLFLNNDAELLNDALSLIYKFMEENKNIGLAGAQNYDQNNNPIPSFDHYKNLYRLLFGRSFLEKLNPKKYNNRKKNYNKPITVNWVIGSFLFFRTDAFNKIGGFDTNIFLYFEEMDICHRLDQQQYKTVLIPSAKILHHVSVSTGISKPINIEAFISHLYVIKKHYSYFHYLSLRLYYIFIFLIKPKKWYLLKYALRNQNLNYSLKQKQKINLIT